MIPRRAFGNHQARFLDDTSTVAARSGMPTRLTELLEKIVAVTKADWR